MSPKTPWRRRARAVTAVTGKIGRPVAGLFPVASLNQADTPRVSEAAIGNREERMWAQSERTCFAFPARARLHQKSPCMSGAQQPLDLPGIRSRFSGVRYKGAGRHPLALCRARCSGAMGQSRRPGLRARRDAPVKAPRPLSAKRQGATVMFRFKPTRRALLLAHFGGFLPCFCFPFCPCIYMHPTQPICTHLHSFPPFFAKLPKT